jgi:hypothetical protein
MAQKKISKKLDQRTDTLSKDEKFHRNWVITTAGLDGKTNTQKRVGKRGKRTYTGGGF